MGTHEYHSVSFHGEEKKNIGTFRLKKVPYFLDEKKCLIWNSDKVSLPHFKKGSCQFLVKECAQILVNHIED